MAKEKSEKKSHKRSRESDVKAEETLDADISMAVTDVDVEDAPVRLILLHLSLAIFSC